MACDNKVLSIAQFKKIIKEKEYRAASDKGKSLFEMIYFTMQSFMKRIRKVPVSYVKILILH